MQTEILYTERMRAQAKKAVSILDVVLNQVEITQRCIKVLFPKKSKLAFTKKINRTPAKRRAKQLSKVELGLSTAISVAQIGIIKSQPILKKL